MQWRLVCYWVKKIDSGLTMMDALTIQTAFTKNTPVLVLSGKKYLCVESQPDSMCYMEVNTSCLCD